MRNFIGFLIICAVFLTGSTSVPAQAATPEGSIDEDPFSGLSIPEFIVTVSESGMSAPDTVPSGSVRLVLDNRTTAPVLVTPMQIAAGDVVDDLKLTELILPNLPPAFHRATWAGGATAMPGETTRSVVVDLSPGEWYLYTWDAPTPDPVPFTVTETAERAEYSPVDPVQTIEMKDFEFVLPARIESGTGMWKIVNSGEQIHDIHILEVPDGTSTETIKHVFFPEDGATPPADLPEAAEFVPYVGLAPLSKGQSFWTEVSFGTGTYMMVTWFAERDSGELQLTLGMLSVFEVVEPDVTS